MVEVRKFPGMRVAYVQLVGPYGEVMGPAFGRLFGWAGANGVAPLGPPLGIYYDDPSQVPPEKLRSEACIPVGPQVRGSGEVQVKDLPAGEVAVLTYKGPYSGVGPAYNELYGWIGQHGYRPIEPCFEVYLNDPDQVPPEELLTEVSVWVEKA
jgi:AraC family transcriptional regulator